MSMYVYVELTLAGLF